MKLNTCRYVCCIWAIEEIFKSFLLEIDLCNYKNKNSKKLDEFWQKFLKKIPSKAQVCNCDRDSNSYLFVKTIIFKHSN